MSFFSRTALTELRKTYSHLLSVAFLLVVLLPVQSFAQFTVSNINGDLSANSFGGVLSAITPARAGINDSFTFGALFDNPQLITVTTPYPSFIKNAGFSLTIASPNFLTLTGGSSPLLNFSGGGTLSLANILFQDVNLSIGANSTLAGNFSAIGASGVGLTLGNGSVVSATTTLGSNLYLAPSAGTATYSGQITGSGTVVVSATGGTVALTNTSNSYNGGTVINGGTLSIGNGGELGTGVVTFNNGVLMTTASLTLTQPMDFSTGSTDTIDVATGTATLSGEFSSNLGTLVKTGTGTLNLSGDSLYAGNTTVNTGTLEFSPTVDLAYAGTLSGAGGIEMSGSHTLTLSADNGYTGGTALNGGTLSVSDDNQLGASTGGLIFNGGTLQTTTGITSSRGIVLNASGGTIDVSGSQDTTLNGTISGAAGNALTKTDAGILTLGGSNSYLGATNITGGTLDIANVNALAGGGQININGTVLQTDVSANLSNAILLNGTGILSVSAGQTTTLNGLVTGGTLLTIGSGTLVLTNNSNSYTANTVLEGGTLSVSNDAQLGNSAGGLVFDGGALQTTTGITSARAIQLSAVGTIDVDSGQTTELDGALSGPGSLTKTDTGTLALTNDSNSYTGGTAVNGGTLSISDDAQLGVGGGLSLNGGTLETTTGITSSRAIQLNAGGGTFDVTSGQTTSLSGLISGTGGLTLTDTGTLVLTNTSNSYSGGTFLNGGTLSVSSNSEMGNISGGLTFNGGILQTTTGFATSRTITLNAGGGTFDAIGGPFLNGVISGAGALTVTGTGTLVLTNSSNNYGGGTVVDNGATLGLGGVNVLGTGGLTLGSGSTLLVNYFSGTVGVNTTVNLSSSVYIDTNGGILDLNGGMGHGGPGSMTLYGGGYLSLGFGSGLGYTGATTIEDGTLNIVSDTNLGTTSGVYLGSGAILSLPNDVTLSASRNLIAGGGSLLLGEGTVSTFNGSLTGFGDLTVESVLGIGTLVFTPSTTIGNTVNLDVLGTTLVVGQASELGTSNNNLFLGGSTLLMQNGFTAANPIFLGASGATVDVATGTTSTLSGLVNGFGLEVTGLGNLVLANSANSYSSGTTVTGGATLSISSDGALGTGGLSLNNGTLATTASLISSRNVTLTGPGGGVFNQAVGTTAAFSGILSGTGSLGKTGLGTLVLSNSNTYSGGTVLSTGTLTVGNNHALGTGTLTLNGGLLTSNGAFTLANNLNQSTASFIGGTNNLTLSGTLNLNSNNLTVNNTGGTIALGGVVSGTGSLTQNGPGGTMVLSNSNSYSGGTNLTAGTLVVGNNGALGTGILTLNGGTLQAGLNGLSLGNDMSLAGADTYDSNGFTSTLSGVLSGTGSLSVVDSVGGGVVTLMGNNTYSGGTILNAGTVVAGDNNALGTGTISVQGGTLLLDAGVVLSSNGVALSAGTTLAANTNTNNTVGSLGGAGSVSIATGSLTTGGDNSNTSLSGTVLGAGGLTKTGTGTLTLSGTNIYTGDTVLTRGTLSISSASNLGPGAVNFDPSGNGTLQTTADGITLANSMTGHGVFDILTGTTSLTGDLTGLTAMTVDGATLNLANAANQTMAIDIDGNGSLEKSGNNNLLLSGTNSYSGGTLVSGGSLEISNDGNLGAAGTTLTLNGGALSLTFGASFTLSRPIVLGTNGGTILGSTAALTLSGPLSGTGGLMLYNGIFDLNTVATYGGATTIGNGLFTSVVNLGQANALPTGTDLLVQTNGTLNLNGYNQQVAGLTGTGTVTNSAGTPGNFTVNENGTETFAGTLSGNLSLTKQGTGTLTLTGNNSYSGGTSILGGTLKIGSDSNLGNSAGDLYMNGGTLAFNNNAASNRTLDLGASGGTVDLISNSVTWNGPVSGTGSLSVVDTSDTEHGILDLTAANSYSGGTSVIVARLGVGNDANLGSAGSTLTLDDGFLQTTASVSFAASRNLQLVGLVPGLGFGAIDAAGHNSSWNGVISGYGMLQIEDTVGGGTVSLTGNNTYTGGTVVIFATVNVNSDAALGDPGGSVELNKGTLQTSAGISFSSGRVLVLDAPTGGTFDTQGYGSSWNGLITGYPGNSGFSVIGGGALTIASYQNGFSNDYGGGTSIGGGTLLNISADSDLGSASTTVTLGGGTLQSAASFSTARNFVLTAAGGTLDTLSNNFVLTGNITGIGGLTKLGDGILELSGSNSYAGNTTIGSGTLYLGVTNALPTDTDLTADGTLDLNGYDQQVGGLNGGGAVTNGSGTLGTFTVNEAGSESFSGTLSSNLALTKTGIGTLTLSGNNSYSGGTDLQAGTLNLGSDNALGTGNLTMEDGTTLQAGVANLMVANNISLVGADTFDTNGNNMTLSGVLSDPPGGSLTKIGTGTLILSGDNTYSGGTSLNAGAIMAANANALGTGSVAVNGGTLMLAGPLTVAIGGSYTQAAGGTLLLGLGPTALQNDHLSVAGAVTLAGTLGLVPYSGFLLHDNETFTLLTAAAVTGTFTTVTDTVGGDAVSVVYNATDVIVDAVANAPSFGVLGQTQNQKNIGGALDNLATTGGDAALISYLSRQANAALPGMEELMSPANLTPLYQMSFTAAQAQAGMIGARVDQLFGNFDSTSRNVSWNGQGPQFAANLSASPERAMAQDLEPQRWGAFANGMGNFGTVTSDGNGPGYQFSTGGTTAGVDYRFSKNFVGGLLLGYSQSGTSQSTGTVNLTGGQVGLYGGWKQDALHIEGLAAGGLNSYTTLRNALGGTATGTTQGQQYSGQLDVIYDLKWDGAQVSPFVSGQYTSVNVNSFTESGSFAPLSFGAQSEGSLTSDLGVSASRKWDLGGIQLSPSLNAAWEHVYQGNTDSLTANFGTGTGNNFTVNGPATGQNAAVLGVGLNAQFDKGFNLFAQYQGKVGLANYTEQNFSGGVNIGF